MTYHHLVAATVAIALLSGTALAQTSTMPQPATSGMSEGAKMPTDAKASVMNEAGMAEAKALLEMNAKGTGRQSYSPSTGVQFKPSDNVYVKSALAIDFTKGKATVTLPLFKGLSPKGEAVYYIITDASDFEVAKQMGINFAPKMKHGAGTPGAQKVTLDGGVIKFKGNVDFAPKYEAVAGSPMPFPPKVAKPGAMADAEWSSLVVMPSGVVLNVQMVHNASGDHDRAKDVDLKKQTVTLSLLDGYQGGKQYFYHLVTDVSADLPAVLEKGVYAPKLALIPEAGKSEPSDKSALLGFSPVLNGITDTKTGQDQGFAASLANGGIDPINIFPVGPNNDDSSDNNNYSPMWDAHVNMWTDAAIRDKKVRRITSFEDLKGLIDGGLVTSADINPAGPGNQFMFGLRPTNALVNCPVIAHPVLTN
jgi:hypothetical protein